MKDARGGHSGGDGRPTEGSPAARKTVYKADDAQLVVAAHGQRAQVEADQAHAVELFLLGVDELHAGHVQHDLVAGGRADDEAQALQGVGLDRRHLGDFLRGAQLDADGAGHLAVGQHDLLGGEQRREVDLLPQSSVRPELL
jgi:hypothetical protein